MWTLRSVLSWILIILSAAVIFIAVSYSKNTVLLIFGKGELRFNSVEEMKKIIAEDYASYELMQSFQGNSGNYIYKTGDDVAAVTISLDGNEITGVSGKIYTENLNLSGITNLKKTIDRAFVPFVHRHDIMPMEIAVLIQMLSDPRIFWDYDGEKVIGGIDMAVFFDINGYTLNFEMNPRLGTVH